MPLNLSNPHPIVPGGDVKYWVEDICAIALYMHHSSIPVRRLLSLPTAHFTGEQADAKRWCYPETLDAGIQDGTCPGDD